ncbi:MAG: hypothetical protein QM781_00605 [Chitinophagaceae bacterium]
MVRKYNWYDPVLVKKMRILLTILIWIMWLMIAYIQQQRIFALLDLL